MGGGVGGFAISGGSHEAARRAVGEVGWRFGARGTRDASVPVAGSGVRGVSGKSVGAFLRTFRGRRDDGVGIAYDDGRQDEGRKQHVTRSRACSNH